MRQQIAFFFCLLALLLPCVFATDLETAKQQFVKAAKEKLASSSTGNWSSSIVQIHHADFYFDSDRHLCNSEAKMATCVNKKANPKHEPSHVNGVLKFSGQAGSTFAGEAGHLYAHVLHLNLTDASAFANDSLEVQTGSECSEVAERVTCVFHFSHIQ